MDSSLSPSSPAETDEAPEETCITRRNAFAAAAALLAAAAAGGIAWGSTIYANDDTSRTWEKPVIHRLSQSSNLFKPGDRPRDDAVVTCTYVNTSYTGGASRSYWGTDSGLDYANDDQRDWPLRSHAFGKDAFSREEADDVSWTDRWTDTITGATLANNAGGCGYAGYGAHHLVSYAIWEGSGFGGGVIPTSLGTWSLHNVSGLTWGSYGTYRSSDYSGGAQPPDSACAFVNASSYARLTCFSVEPEAVEDDYRLHYCLYCFVMFTDIGISVSHPYDNYAGIVYAWATAAGIRCEARQTGLGRVAEILLDNVNRGFAHRYIAAETISALASRVEAGEITVAEAFETALSGFSRRAWYANSSVAAEALIAALLQYKVSTSKALDCSHAIIRNGCGAGARTVLETEAASGALPFPIEYGSLTCSIEEEDVTGDTQAIALDGDGVGKSGRVFTYGTYTGSLTCSASGWDAAGETQATVTIPDNGSGLWFPLSFDLAAPLPAVLEVTVTITFKRDAAACTALGLTATCYEETASDRDVYTPSAEACEAGKRPGCSSWSGWFLDESCTSPYEPTTLCEDLTLYCLNGVIATWELTEGAALTEERFGGTLFSDEALTEPTTLAALLPPSTTALWGDSYTPPELASVWRNGAGRAREAQGSTYRNAGATVPLTEAITLMSDTTLYGNWDAGIYDGVNAT